MTAWTTSADLRAQVLRRWERDELLAASFPLRLVLRAPASADLSDRFDAARAWAAEISQGARAGYRVYEVPVSYAGRSYEEGKKITWKDGFVAVKVILGARFRAVGASPTRAPQVQ